MKRKLLLSSFVIPALLASGAMGQVVNFHDAENGQLAFPGVGYEELFVGQGAYSDPGNDIWNGFGFYHGYASTYFYSGGPDGAAPWPQESGNPGNPYAAYNAGSGWVTSTGPNLFNFGTGGLTNTGNATSSGQFTPITLDVSPYDADTGIAGAGAFAVPNGTPSFLLGESASQNGANPTEVFALRNVPPGSYGLYLYGVQYENNRGTLFSVSSGAAHNGIDATLNNGIGTPASTFVEGQNFVIFENVSPDASGTITITASPNPNDGLGNNNLTNETDVNGFQLIFNPPPTAQGITAAQNVYAGRTASFSFTPVFATGATYQWQSVIGGVTNNLANGGNISGATTTSLTIANVSSADVGLYQCVLTAGAKVKTSPAAPLTILTSTATGPLQAGDLTSVSGNVLEPGDTLIDVNSNTVAPYNSLPPPFDMTVVNVEDNTLYQYVNFGSNGSVAPFAGPVGFIVTPQIGSTIVTGLRLFTSSSHPEDDPSDYLLTGSNNGSNFTAIAGGLLALPAARNAAGGPINITNQALQEITFANTNAYSTYQLTFTNVNSDTDASNGVQIAEVQLLGSWPSVPPGIVQQPVSNTVLLAGATLNAGVMASGPGPLTYQWYFNTTTPVANATNALLALADLQLTNTGIYHCAIANPYGSTNSSTLRLTVVAPSAYEAAVLADQPLAFYPLDETNGTTAYDVIGGYDGGYSNGPTLDVPGPSTDLPAAASFDGSSQYVFVPSTPALNFGGQVTLEAWVQPTASELGLANIIAKGYDGNQNDNEIQVRAQGTDFDGGYYNATAGGEGAAGGAVVAGSWTHVVLTWDGAYWNLYVNGILAGKSADPVGLVKFSDPWAIADGTTSGDTRYFAGGVCAAAIYNHALTPAQVEAHYFATGVPPIITGPPESSVVIVNSNVTMSVTAIGELPLSYQWYDGTPGPSTLIAAATNSTLPFVHAQLTSGGYYDVVVTDKNGLSDTSAPALLNVLASPLPGSYFSTVVGLNPLAYWPLNETNQPALLDYAQNLGTLGPVGNAVYSESVTFQNPGALADTNTGVTNFSVQTDGSTAYAALPFSPVLSNQPPFTVEAWLNSANISATECALACMDGGETVTGNRAGWLLYMDDTGGPGTYNFRGYNENGLTPSINIATATAVTAGTWHHIVVVVNTNGTAGPTNGIFPLGSVVASIYLDGQLSGTSPAEGYGMNDNGGFTIGVRSDLGFYFAGEEAEVAYYTNALSSNTISAHYAAGTNTSPATPYYKLVLQSNPMLFYQLDEPQVALPDPSTDPLALNYGGTGSNDNGIYFPGAIPASVPGPDVVGFPGKGSNNLAVSFNHFNWNPGGDDNNATGLSGFIEVPYNTGDLNVIGPVSLTAWIQAAPSDGRFQTPVGRGDNSYRVDVDGTITDELHFAYGGAGDLLGTTPAGFVNDGQWHFVVGEWDGGLQSLYVDGVLNASNAAAGPPAGTTLLDFTIGEAPDDTGRVFDGNMSQVAIFPYALS
ncbi:MAG TPA: LamG-like jellyroll fold domain-containing protein, partial [Verrucomicrobiae bacterium]|nr:LamG-like jellyroll fold domain-containing protein [Verrucomicrobiae bacterium]